MREIKPAGEPWLKRGETLFCFGDSLTASSVGYVPKLQAHLEPLGINVVNAGRSGDKTPWAMTRLVSDVISKKPDAVSFYFGANDGVIGHGRWADEPVVSPDTYRDLLVWMVHLCKLYGGTQKFSIAAPPLRGEGPSFLEFGFAYAAYSRAAREAADIAATLLVPLDSVFFTAWEKHHGEADDNGLRFTADGLHGNQEGYTMIADTMLRTWDL